MSYSSDSFNSQPIIELLKERYNLDNLEFLYLLEEEYPTSYMQYISILPSFSTGRYGLVWKEEEMENKMLVDTKVAPKLCHVRVFTLTDDLTEIKCDTVFRR